MSLLKPLLVSARRHPARLSSGRSAPRVFPPMNRSCAVVLAPVFGRLALWIGDCVPRTISFVRDGLSMLVDLKVLQQVTDLMEEVLHEIFLDLHKAYNALDRSRCLGILEGYGVGPRDLRLLQLYWARLRMVARAGG